MAIISNFSLHGVKKIEAHTYADLPSAPLIIGFQADDFAGGWSEIIIHTDNPALTAALVKAINDAVASVKPAPEVEAA